ncbi:hypothetical protein H6P81_021706 [Aristolochia fimbriata]|uniref:Uncharacterized protein n=1 Tax=Aristolochia fimbriata TaxID=158543 RepID=A0AAV7DP72_ARIFI|nr:hypothetical protein H6P81_021706 [Aristolochia fimbriata]
MPLIIGFYPIELATGAQLSRGKLRGNQLLDGSISLSPLYPSRRTICIAKIAMGLHQSFSGFAPPGIVHHLSVPAGRSTVQPARGSRQSASFAPLRVWSPTDSHTHVDSWSVFQDGSNGEPAGRRQERQRCHEGTPAEVATTLLSVTVTDDDPLAGSSAWLVASRGLRCRSTPRSEGRTDARAPQIMTGGASPPPSASSPDNFKHFLTFFKPLTEFTASIWAAFPNNPTRRQRQRRSSDTGSGTTGCHPSLGAPFHGTCAVRPQRTLQTTPTGEKPPILIPGSSRSPLLGESFWCSHLTWGRIRARPPGHGGNRRGGPSSEPGPLTPTSSHAGPGRAEPPLSRPGALGAKCFSANLARGGKDDQSARPTTTARTASGGQQGTGGGRTRRADAQADSMVRGILQFTPSIAISPRSSSMREPRYPLSRVVRLPCSRSDRRRRTFFLFAWHRSPSEVVVRGVRPRPSAGSPTLSPPGAGSLTLVARDSTGAATRRRRRRWASWCSSLAWSRRFGESTMILPQVQWTSRNASGGEPPTPPLIQHFTDHSIGRSDGRCVQRAGIESTPKLMTRAY